MTFSARKYLRLCWREGLGVVGGWLRCFKPFLEYTYFSRLAKVFSRILQPFFMFFSFIRSYLFIFLTSWIFIPLFVFSLIPLLVTRYCVTLFSNTLQHFTISLRFIAIYKKKISVRIILKLLSLLKYNHRASSRSSFLRRLRKRLLMWRITSLLYKFSDHNNDLLILKEMERCMRSLRARGIILHI